MWAKIITIKRTKDLNYFSLWAFNLFNTRVSQFELNYWNKWTFPRHSNLFRYTCNNITEKKNHRQNCECVLCTDEGLMSYLQMYSTGCVVLFRWDMAWGKTVLVSGCFGAQWSVAPARGQQFKESGSWVWGVQSAFLSSVPHSGGVKFLGIVESYVWGRGKIHYQE